MRACMHACTHASVLLPRLFLVYSVRVYSRIWTCIFVYAYVSYSHSSVLGQHIRPSTSCISCSRPTVFLLGSSRCLRCLASAAAFFRCLCAGTEWQGHMAPLCQRTLCRVCSVGREDTRMSNTCVRK